MHFFKYNNIFLLSWFIVFVGSSQNLHIKPNITKTDSVGVYQMNMYILNRHVSGIVFFRQITDSSYRVVLTSEMGPKILDMNIDHENYQLNFAIKQLKRKTVLKSFYNDFSAIAGLKLHNQNPAISQVDTAFIYEYILNRKERFAIIQHKKNDHQQTIFFRKSKRQWEMDRYYNSNLQIDSVFLRHNDFNLQMELRKIEM